MDRNDGGPEMTKIELRLDASTTAFIVSVADSSGVSPDEAASVIAVLALHRYLGAPMLAERAKERTP